jgi:hypothetical protein
MHIIDRCASILSGLITASCVHVPLNLVNRSKFAMKWQKRRLLSHSFFSVEERHLER